MFCTTALFSIALGSLNNPLLRSNLLHSQNCIIPTDGYVPADEFGSMPFNLTLSLMYLIVAIAWGVLCFWYR